MGVAQQRLMVIMLLFMLVSGVIAARLVQICLFSNNQGRSGLPAAGARGAIYDRNGVPLATTIKLWTVAINPRKVLGDREALAIKLAQLMPERSVQDYRRMLYSGKAFFYLRRPAPPELAAAVNALGDPGMVLLTEPRRLFPQGMLGGHILGYSQMTAHGLTGIGAERYFDADLAKGGSVNLSIDTRVQAALEDEIARRMSEVSAIGGAGVVLDADTGEVLGMASLPDINPNDPLKSARDPNNHDMINKVTLATYELGSTFKMLTFANAIEHGVITDWAKTYNVSSPLHIGSHTIHDDEPKHRALTVPEVMTFSSNIGTAQIAEEIGPDRVKAFFGAAHMFTPTQIELRERGTPQLPRDWGRATVMTTAFGHGIAVTPLHLAEAYAALANGGIWHPATLLRHEPGKPVPADRLVSEQTSAKMRQLMRLVVLQGTGTNANAPGLRVGGKTGTAEKIVNGHYVKNSNITTFAGAFPMDHPRYVVLVVLDDAKASKGTYGFKTAGWMTAPLAKRIIARIGPLLGIRPEDGKDVDESDLMPLILEKKVPGKNEVE
ncbi:penicillin-binding protein 2 [Sphingomonas nostoxanthinifaciens]|nr:penicillin-binding protein 2 [Sphingomonas nostoxanthinifaciens]